MSTYTLIDSTGARTHLSREQVAEALRCWDSPEQPHAVFGRFEGCGLLVSGPNCGFMFVSRYEAGDGWIEMTPGDADIMRAWLAGEASCP
jgi:hypothetical protein